MAAGIDALSLQGVRYFDKTNGISYYKINTNFVSFLMHRRQKKCQE